MNFPGPLNSDLASATAVSLESEHFSFAPQPKVPFGHSKADGVVVPDKHLLFCGDYARDGNDLVLSDANQKYVVHDYFKGEKRPALISEDGAMLSGHIVSSLTGHVQYAQATAPDAAQIVGHVMKLTGSASVVRNGVAVELHIGDAVQKGDVVQTGSDSTVAMTLIDGSAFGMTSNARMVLNEMVYDPNGSSNSSFISLVQGTVTFVAGQTAKNGNMRVETPVATMGIRGTAVLVKIYSDTGVVETSLGVEPDGHVGGYAFYDNVTGALLGTVTQAGRVTIISPGGVGQPATASEQPLTPQAVQADKILFNQVYQLYFPNFNPDDSKPKSTDHPRTDIGIPPTILGKLGSDPDTGRATITYTIAVTNPDTHVTSNISIVYINTPPSFSVTNEYDVQAIVTGTHSFKLGDQVVITDPDINLAPFFDVATPYVANSGALANATGPSSIMFGSYYLYNTNLVSFDPATGLVTYNPEGFRFLAENETAIYKFTFTASSGVGSSGSDSAGLTLLLTITGENDAPVIVAGSTTAAKGVIEDAAVDAGHNIKATGTVTFQDFDLTDAHTASFVPTSTSISTPLPGFTNTTSLGAFTILPVAENLTDTNDTGTVVWNFVLDNNNTTLQSLAEGQKITQTYTITITDSHGVAVEQIVTVTITGTNDQPILNADTAMLHSTVEAPNATGSGTLVDTVSGSLTFADVDLIDTHQVGAQLDPGTSSVVWTGGLTSGIPQATLDALDIAMTAAINTDSTNTGAGWVDWTFKLADHLSDFLAHGETLTVVYDITVTDNSGTATNTSLLQQVTVQIAAANDRPVITAIDSSAVVIEDLAPNVSNFLTDQGSVTFNDADLTDTHTAKAIYNNDAVDSTGAIVSPALLIALATAMTVPSSTMNASIHTFNWDFALDNSLIQYLGAGETITATYTIGVTDNSQASDASAVGQVVTVIITGTNDAPVAVADTITNDTPPSTAAGWVLNPDNGHYYRYVGDLGNGVSWTAAQAAAATDVGYLATVTSSQESSFVYNLIANHTFGGTWLGGYSTTPTDTASWYWASGPEQGLHFTYTNWSPNTGNTGAGPEPNGPDSLGAAGLNINPDETWNDVPTSENDHFGGFGYVEEWGGQAAQVVFREDTGTTLTTQQLLANDTDVDTPHASLSITAVSDASAHGGTVRLDGNIITYHPATDYSGADSFQYTLSDGSLTSTGTVSFNVAAGNGEPTLHADNASPVEIGDGGVTHPDGTTQVFGLTVSDPDETGNLHITAVADHGSVTDNSNNSLASVSETVSQINGVFTNGIIYTPTSVSPDDIDHLTLTTTDSGGLSDTLTFVFHQQAGAGATLTGTAGNDLIFAAADGDTLTGLAGADNFVFAPHAGAASTITDFQSGQDKIVLNGFDALSIPPDSSGFTAWLAIHATGGTNAVIDLNNIGDQGPHETITLTGVAAANLHANDFIIHSA